MVSGMDAELFAKWIPFISSDMAQIIQLSLNFGQAPVSEPQPIRETPQGDLPLNPCINCSLNGLCDSDDCGMHLFSLDTPTKFRNLNEFIIFKKSQGWG